MEAQILESLKGGGWGPGFLGLRDVEAGDPASWELGLGIPGLKWKEELRTSLLGGGGKESSERPDSCVWRGEAGVQDSWVLWKEGAEVPHPLVS